MSEVLYTDTNVCEEREAVFGEADSGKRLDAALAEVFPDLSRSRIQALLESGLARPSGLTKNTRVKAGDSVTLIVNERVPLKAEPEDLPINVVYEDDDVIVVDKERGMVVHPAKGNTAGTLVNALLWHYAASGGGVTLSDEGRLSENPHAMPKLCGNIVQNCVCARYYSEKQGKIRKKGTNRLKNRAQSKKVAKKATVLWQSDCCRQVLGQSQGGVTIPDGGGVTLSDGGGVRPGIVHRIDKNTSGLLVVTKNDAALESLAAQFAAHAITRRYMAIVLGGFSEEEGTVDAPLGRDPKNRLKQAVLKEGGKNAITHWRVLERLSGRHGVYTLLELKLETGRTHQIRAHMAHMGHPVLGDDLYGAAKGPAAHEGQYLHAFELGFDHPSSGECLLFESPLPPYFSSMLDKLRL